MPDFSKIVPDKLTLGQLAELYLTTDAINLVPDALDDMQRYINVFVSEFGSKRLAGSIRKWEVLTWIQRHAEWGPTMKRGVIQRAGRMFNWAMELEILDRNPFWRVKRMLPMANVGRRVIEPEEFQTLLRHSPPYVRRLLLFLRLTGCRPSEAYNLRWEELDLDKGIATLTRHKTMKKTRKPRVIFLVPALVKMLRWMKRTQIRNFWHAGRLTIWGASELLKQILGKGPRKAKEVLAAMAAKGCSANMLYRVAEMIGARATFHGRGVGAIWTWHRSLAVPHAAPVVEVKAGGSFVFVHERGEPWLRHSFAHCLRRICQRRGLDSGIVTYGLRHTWATNAIRRGVPILLVSRCLGHSRTSTTEEVYIHVDQDLDLLHRAAADAVTRTAATNGKPRR